MWDENLGCANASSGCHDEQNYCGYILKGQVLWILEIAFEFLDCSVFLYVIH